MCSPTPGALSIALLTLGHFTSAAASNLQESPKASEEKREQHVSYFYWCWFFFFSSPLQALANLCLSSVMVLCSFTIKVIYQRDRIVFSACLPERYSWLQELHSLFLMSSYMVLGAFPTPSIPLTAETL